MRRRLLAIAIVAPWVVWAVVRALGLDTCFLVVAAIAFTPYAAATSPIPVLAGLALREWAAAGIAVVAAVVLLACVSPRAFSGPQPKEARGPRLVVMTANLNVSRAHAGEILRLADAYAVDVLSVQEITPEGLGGLDAAGAAATFPGRAADPQAGSAGLAVLSRTALRRTGPAAGTIAPAGVPPVHVTAAHPPAPVSRAATGRWRAAMRALPASDGRGDVEIVAGDLNATLDHRELRRLLDRGYVDAADAAGEGLAWTWAAPRRRKAPWVTIDHVLVDRRVAVRRVAVERVRGSNHRAVIAELALPAA